VTWGYRLVGKRLFDVGLALVGLCLFALPMVGIALGVWMDSGYPILFRQIRIGHAGKPFLLWKFRTMNEAGTVTGLGRILRATAMDELPQLFQILLGQMSFVGPRPLIPEELRQLQAIPEGNRRLLLKPGLTGLAQLYSDKSPSLTQRLRWDLLYAKGCSLWLDGTIVAKSIWVTTRGGWEQPGSKVPLKGNTL